MVKSYLDFELHVRRVADHIEIDINGRPFGISLPEPLRLPTCLTPVSYRSLNEHPNDIATAGHSLFQSVFCAEVQAAFAAYVARREEFEGVRVCIETPTNDLTESVWEILCDVLMPAANFLALDPKTPVIRITRVPRGIYYRPLVVPLRMLIVLATPRLLQKIKPEEVRASLEPALEEAVAQDLITVRYLGFDEAAEANFDTLQEHLAAQGPRYDVVHIIGHGILEPGQEGKVALVNPRDGKMQGVDASSLANLFRSRGVMLVILQSCQSGAVDTSAASFSGLAQQMVAAGVPAVLAMQEIIDQDVARDFIGKLYKQWISGGVPFEDSLTQARQGVYEKYKERVAPWAIPVLYIVPGLQLILGRPSDRPAQTLPMDPPPPTERLVDAALPKQIRLGRETTLLVLVRTPAAEGLREKIGARPRDFEAAPEDVTVSPTFDVTFGRDEQSGKLLPGSVKIVIETKDFDLDRSEETVQMRPQGDSVLCFFPMTPRKEGPAILVLRVLDASGQDVSLTQMLLRTEVRGGERFETEYHVTDAAQTADEQAQLALLAYNRLERDSASLLDSSQEMRHYRTLLQNYTTSFREDLRERFLSAENRAALRNQLNRIAAYVAERPVGQAAEASPRRLNVEGVRREVERLAGMRQYLDEARETKEPEYVDLVIADLSDSYGWLLSYLRELLGSEEWRVLVGEIAGEEEVVRCPECLSILDPRTPISCYTAGYPDWGEVDCAYCGYPGRLWKRGYPWRYRYDFGDHLRRVLDVNRKYLAACEEKAGQAARLKDRLAAFAGSPWASTTRLIYGKVADELKELEQQVRSARDFQHNLDLYFSAPSYSRLLRLEALLKRDY